jgi:hypothetical protein
MVHYVPACRRRSVASSVDHPLTTRGIHPGRPPVPVTQDRHHGYCACTWRYTLTFAGALRPHMRAWFYSIDRRPPAGHTLYPPRPSTLPRHAGPPPRLLRVNMAIYIDIQWSIVSPHARFVLLHRPSTTVRPHAVSTPAAPRPRRPGPPPRLLRVSMAIDIDIQWSITFPHACLVLFRRPSTTRRPHAVSTPAAPPPPSPWTTTTATACEHGDIH